MTAAAFLGCLAALVAAAFLYKYLLNKKVAEETAKLEKVRANLVHHEELLEETVAEQRYQASKIQRPNTKPVTSGIRLPDEKTSAADTDPMGDQLGKEGGPDTETDDQD